MSAREWEPGDVALVLNEHGIWNRAIYSIKPIGMVWQYGVTDAIAPMNAAARPLVVTDPEDREQVERLTAAWESAENCALDNAEPMTVRQLRMRAALRSLIEPPKPEAPTGLGALVEANYESDSKGFGPAYWALAEDGSWRCLSDGMTSMSIPWAFLTNVRVLSVGVTP